MFEFDVFDEIRRLRRELDRMFEVLAREPVRFVGWREPLADIKETPEEVIVEIELPGMNKDDIQLKATEDYLEVKAEAKKLIDEKHEGFYRKERSYRGFYRKILLPTKVKPEDARAKYENGVLTIVLPKKEPEKEKKVKEIRVE